MMTAKSIAPNWPAIKSEAEKRMRQVDSMPLDVRGLIHDFNVNPVVDLYQRGLDRVEDIRAVLTERNTRGDEAAKSLYFRLRRRA